MLIVSDAWKTAYPGAAAGVLVMQGVTNPERHPELERKKAELENRMRSQYQGSSREALRSMASIQPYEAYYGRFKKTYHVLLQLESVAIKGRPLPRVAALVEAMFMAELQNQLLTAGHDLQSIQGAIRLEVAEGGESYTLLNGQGQSLKPGDMYMADEAGIISSVLNGPDQRTRLTPSTRQALFAVYAPPGIEAEAVRKHLEEIRDYVWVIAPAAEAVTLKVFEAQ